MKLYCFFPEGEDRKGEGGLKTKGYFKKTFKDKPLISIVTVVFNGEYKRVGLLWQGRFKSQYEKALGSNINEQLTMIN